MENDVDLYRCTEEIGDFVEIGLYSLLLVERNATLSRFVNLSWIGQEIFKGASDHDVN